MRRSKAFVEACRFRPDWAKALRYLGDALGQRGERDEAERATGARWSSTLPTAKRTRPSPRCWSRPIGWRRRWTSRKKRCASTLATCARRSRRRASNAGSATEAALRRLDELDARGADPESRAYAAFERGQILDRLGVYGRAYQAYLKGNALLADTSAARDIDRQFFPGLIERLADRFTPAWVETWTPPPLASGDRPDLPDRLPPVRYDAAGANSRCSPGAVDDGGERRAGPGAPQDRAAPRGLSGGAGAPEPHCHSGAAALLRGGGSAFGRPRRADAGRQDAAQHHRRRPDPSAFPASASCWRCAIRATSCSAASCRQ